MSWRPGRAAGLVHRDRWGAAARSAATVPVVATLVVLAAALVFPQFEGANVTVMGVATEALTYGLVTLALNLLMGYGGQVSIGHGGFLAVGAYTAAILSTHAGGLPFIVVLALAALTLNFLLGCSGGLFFGPAA